MDIEFTKMQGAGNDYVYIDLIKNRYDIDYPELAGSISNRHFGVGGDGLVLIMESDRADYRMRMFNSDGSEAEMCGNAVRCVGKYLADRGYVTRTSFSIETLAGIKNLRITERDHSGRVSSVRVDMGEPILNGRDIPSTLDGYPVRGVDIQGYKATLVSMGNPHAVIFVDRITDHQVLVDGPRIEVNPLFPNKTNVEFIEVEDRATMRMRVWERGSGETLACGTGACAGAVAGVLNDLTGREVDVQLLGGTLSIHWSEGDNRVYLTGPAVEVFSGVYHHPSFSRVRT